MTDIDVKEYPEGYKGRRAYVFITGVGLVAACYTCSNGAGRAQVAPEYGGPPVECKRTPAPQVMRDMGEYRSPVDGAYISSRSQHRDHVRAHDLVEVGTERVGSLDKPQDSGSPIGQDIKQALYRAKQG